LEKSFHFICELLNFVYVLGDVGLCLEYKYPVYQLAFNKVPQWTTCCHNLPFFTHSSKHLFGMFNLFYSISYVFFISSIFQSWRINIYWSFPFTERDQDIYIHLSLV
jgi:hypothetical protein